MKTFRIFLVLLSLLGLRLNAATDSIPRPDHVVIIILENRAYEQVIGDTSLKYIRSLGDSGALFTKSYGLYHPSVRNYLTMFSGSDQGVPANISNPSTGFPYKTRNLAASMIKKGFTFKGYTENLKYPGYSGGDTVGGYGRRHSPWVYWQGTDSNQIDSMLSLNMDSFPKDYSKLPNLCFFVGNLNHILHNDTTAKGKKYCDNWLKSKIDSYAKWSLKHNSLLVLTFDEDDNKHSNHIYTVFYGQKVKKGKYTEKITHYNILRTFEKMYAINPPMGTYDSTQKAIIDCWDTTHPVVIDTTSKDTTTTTDTTHHDTTHHDTTVTAIRYARGGNAQVSIYPNPANSILHLTTANNALARASARLYISDFSGRILLDREMCAAETSIDVSTLPPGVYLLRYQDAEKVWNGKFVKE